MMIRVIMVGKLLMLSMVMSGYVVSGFGYGSLDTGGGGTAPGGGYINDNSYITSTSNIQVLRILRSYSHGVFLHCPMTSNLASEMAGVYQVRWVNEKDSYNKPDDQVMVNDYTLLSQADVNLQVNQAMTYVSCGYVFNFKFIRIKIWQLVFIDEPKVEISIVNNPSLIQYSIVNGTHSSISLPQGFTVDNWSKPVDLLRVKCKNNFDHPINTRYVWMYLYNPQTLANEIWHKFDVDEETAENVYQIFYNPNSNKKMHLSEFLIYFYTQKLTLITFQCGTYYEENYSKEKICLIANSLNITLILGEYNKHHAHHHHGNSVNTGLLIGTILAGIFFLLLLLGLLALLIYCCCIRRRRREIPPTKSTSIIFPAINTEHSYNNIQTISNLNTTSNYVGTMSSTHMVADKASQFSNQLDAHNCASAVTNVPVCSNAPDVYLSMLTIHKDSADDDCCAGAVVNDHLHHHNHHHHHHNQDEYTTHYQYEGNVRNETSYAYQVPVEEEICHHVTSSHHNLRNLNNSTSNNNDLCHMHNRQHNEYNFQYV